MLKLCFSIALLFIRLNVSLAFIEDLYCGQHNCYELLGVDQSVEKSELSKVYRQLAKKWHPDRFKKTSEKENAAQKFTEIATAYEVLKDEDTRRDYDYMLDHPEEYYSHYYRYYKRRVTPKLDPRIVVAVTITLISIVQYFSAHKNYNLAIDYLLAQSKYRIQAQQIAQEQGLIGGPCHKKKDRQKTKQEIKEEENAILRKIVEDKFEISGGVAKPHWYDILWAQIFMWPWYLLQWIYYQLRWFFLFTLGGRPLGDEEKHYLIRRNLKFSKARYEGLEETHRQQFMKDELWIKDNFLAYKAEQEEEQKRCLANNSQYKRYRRYMKKGGAGQISVGPD